MSIVLFPPTFWLLSPSCAPDNGLHVQLYNWGSLKTLLSNDFQHNSTRKWQSNKKLKITLLERSTPLQTTVTKFKKYESIPIKRASNF